MQIYINVSSNVARKELSTLTSSTGSLTQNFYEIKELHLGYMSILNYKHIWTSFDVIYVLNHASYHLFEG